jgi:uncharacterized protein (TIGR02271 family)
MSSGMTTGSTSRRLVTAFFDSRSDAEQAISRLHEAGIAQDGIRLTASDQDGGTSRGTDTQSFPEASAGLWDSLRDLFLPDEDRHTYTEGLRRGGYLLSVEASDAQYERVLDILDDEGTIDIDERANSWREEGWSGETSGIGRDDVLSGATANLTMGDAATTSGTTMGTSAGLGGTAGVTDVTGAGTTSMGTAAGATRLSDDLTSSDAGSATPVLPVSGGYRDADLNAGASAGLDRDVTSTGGTGLTGTEGRLVDRGEEVIPVAQERLQVGRRDVSHGRVRVRSYVVETPVQEQVTLREERVAVERRPADRALSDVEQAFQERTIEAEERGEEAVVSKEARVTEEVVVRKEAEQRTETVSDTVRQTEVEVEDERGNRISGTGTTDRT